MVSDTAGARVSDGRGEESMEGLVLEGVNEEQEHHGSRLSWVVAESARGLVGRCLRLLWRAVQQAESPSFSAVWHHPGVHLCLPWLVSPSTFKIWCLTDCEPPFRDSPTQTR